MKYNQAINHPRDHSEQQYQQELGTIKPAGCWVNWAFLRSSLISFSLSALTWSTFRETWLMMFGRTGEPAGVVFQRPGPTPSNSSLI